MAGEGNGLNNTIYVIEHWATAEPDAGRRHLIAQGFDVQVVEPWKGETLPQLSGEEAGVMVMGGPQMISVAGPENHPYLLDELVFIEQTLARDIPMVGVCLGSQMIAKVLGAKVDFHPQRHIAMGFYPIKATAEGKQLGLADDMMVLNGNAQNWDIPSGTTFLAASDGDNPHPNQAFSTGKTLALQFHPEVTRPILDQWQTEFASLIGAPGTHLKVQQDAGFENHDAPLKTWYFEALDRWFTRTH